MYIYISLYLRGLMGLVGFEGVQGRALGYWKDLGIWDKD